MERLLTVETYLQQRYDLTDEGRWHDLVAGELVPRQQPSDLQGIAILNLTRILGDYFLKTATEQTAYACFELGLILARDPDSVRFPAISVYRDGNRFAHLDELMTDQFPMLAIDHARNPTANSGLAGEYLRRGVEAVWLIDSDARSLEVYHLADELEMERHQADFDPEAEWPDLHIHVPDLFADPDQRR